MQTDTLRKPRQQKRAKTDGELRQGSRSLGPRVVRYRLRVSKDERSFADVLKDVIERWYESDSDFAASAGVSNSAVSRWASGKQVPTPAKIEQIAPFMRMPAARLLGIAYPGTGTPDARLGPDVHPLVLDLARMLGPNSPLPDDKRDTLMTLIDALVAPYRRFLRVRKSA